MKQIPQGYPYGGKKNVLSPMGGVARDDYKRRKEQVQVGLGQMNGEMKEGTPDCYQSLNSNQGHPEDRRLSTLKSRKGLEQQQRDMGEARVMGLASPIKGTAEISFYPDLWSPVCVVVIFLSSPAEQRLWNVYSEGGSTEDC